MSKRFVEQLKRAAAKKSRAMRMEKMTDAEVAEALEPSRDPFLLSAEWKAMRAKVLATYGAKCMCCGRMPKDLSQINVDHIKCRRDYPELALEFDNLQVLCGRCNKEKGNKHSTDYRAPRYNISRMDEALAGTELMLPPDMPASSIVDFLNQHGRAA